MELRCSYALELHCLFNPCVRTGPLMGGLAPPSVAVRCSAAMHMRLLVSCQARVCKQGNKFVLVLQEWCSAGFTNSPSLHEAFLQLVGVLPGRGLAVSRMVLPGTPDCM